MIILRMRVHYFYNIYSISAHMGGGRAHVKASLTHCHNTYTVRVESLIFVTFLRLRPSSSSLVVINRCGDYKCKQQPLP